MQDFYHLQVAFLNFFKNLYASTTTTTLGKTIISSSSLAICSYFRFAFAMHVVSSAADNINLDDSFEIDVDHNTLAFLASFLKIAASIFCNTSDFYISC